MRNASPTSDGSQHYWRAFHYELEPGRSSRPNFLAIRWLNEWTGNDIQTSLQKILCFPTELKPTWLWVSRLHFWHSAMYFSPSYSTEFFPPVFTQLGLWAIHKWRLELFRLSCWWHKLHTATGVMRFTSSDVQVDGTVSLVQSIVRLGSEISGSEEEAVS